MGKNKKTQTSNKDPSRLRAYSFLITILIISLLVVGSYYQSLPKIEHIPSSFEFKSQDWMSYVPHDVEYVSYVNYQESIAITHNSTLFGSSILLELPQVNFAVFPSDIVYEVVLQPPEPQFSGSTTILQLTQDRTSALVQGTALVNLTKTRAPFPYSGYVVQELLMRKFGEQEYNLGYLSVVNQHIILSNDKNTGLQDVEFVLDQIHANATNLFDGITIRSAVYATGVTDQSYAGLFVGMFSTQLNDTKMAVKSIVGNGNSILVSRALLFPTPDIALERLDQAHQIYRGSASFRILDSWLVVEYTYPSSRLQAELTGI